MKLEKGKELRQKINVIKGKTHLNETNLIMYTSKKSNIKKNIAIFLPLPYHKKPLVCLEQFVKNQIQLF